MRGIVSADLDAQAVKTNSFSFKAIPNQLVLWLIMFYQKVVSAALPKVCRFTPSCSQYGFQAFNAYPFFKALWLTIRRIARCHPFHKGGYDPLP
jgi:putative membrane protein insertion efficiency factor